MQGYTGYRVCRGGGGGGGGGGGRSTAPGPLFSASGAHCAASWRCAITRPARRCRFRSRAAVITQLMPRIMCERLSPCQVASAHVRTSWGEVG
eukprot:scaffold69652_cov62-Phaeocystis_antarctica.AAC.2